MEDSIKIVTEPNVLISHYHWFEEMPTTNLEPSIMLSRCLDGTYITLGFYEGEIIVGIAIIRDLNPEAVIVGINLINKTKKFYDKFYKVLSVMGFKKLEAYSSLPKEKFERFSGFKQIYSVYEKEI